MPPVMAMRDFFTLSSLPQLTHFMPMEATPSPITVRMILMTISARVAWRAPIHTQKKKEKEKQDVKVLTLTLV